MGLPEQLKDLWLKILGGANPPGAASASGDIGQMIKYLVTGTVNVWTPFGLVHPYYGAGIDTVISALTTIPNQFQQYRDLTINSGITLTAGFSPQIIICRSLIFGNTGSNISALGKGGAGGIAGGVTGGPGGVGVSGFPASDGGSGGVTGGVGAAASEALKGAYLLGQFMAGRGGGGGGGGGTTNGGPGGDGVGGGGGGGQNATPGAGGAGGGVLIIICDTIQGAVGALTANANTGTLGGGGGGGGLVLVYTRTLTTTPTFQTTGGSGAGGGAAGGAGCSALIRSA